jgi:hypothetical protein
VIQFEEEQWKSLIGMHSTNSVTDVMQALVLYCIALSGKCGVVGPCIKKN